MKRLSVLTMAVFVSACGLTYSTSPMTPAEATGSSSATVTLVTTKDAAGNVIATTATIVVDLSRFPAGTAINIARIRHAAGVDAERQRLPRVNVLIVDEPGFVPFDRTGDDDGQVEEQRL